MHAMPSHQLARWIFELNHIKKEKRKYSKEMKPWIKGDRSDMVILSMGYEPPEI